MARTTRAVSTRRALALAERTMSRPTAPFREGAVIEWVREFSESNPHLRLREDPDGNLHLSRRGVRADRSPLVLNAHMDHPGFRAIRSQPRREGFRVEARFLGGVRHEYFPDAKVRFFDGERTIRARVRSIRAGRSGGDPRVDLVADDRVPRGAFGMWDLPAFRRSRRDPDLLETRVADDLAGVAAVLALLEAIDRIDPRRSVDVRGLFTRAEEVGFVGALAVAAGQRIPAGSRVIAIEASKALPEAPQGAGPILRVGDRTSLFDDRLTRWIARVGSDLAGPGGKRFAWQRKLMDGGTCEATAYQLFGYRFAAMCLPLGNYHNMSDGGRIAAETIRLSDLVGLVRFFEGMVRADRDAPRGRARDPLRTRLDRVLARRRRELARSPFAG